MSLSDSRSEGQFPRAYPTYIQKWVFKSYISWSSVISARGQESVPGKVETSFRSKEVEVLHVYLNLPYAFH